MTKNQNPKGVTTRELLNASQRRTRHRVPKKGSASECISPPAGAGRRGGMWNPSFAGVDGRGVSSFVVTLQDAVPAPQTVSAARISVAICVSLGDRQALRADVLEETGQAVSVLSGAVTGAFCGRTRGLSVGQRPPRRSSDCSTSRHSSSSLWPVSPRQPRVEVSHQVRSRSPLRRMATTPASGHLRSPRRAKRR